MSALLYFMDPQCTFISSRVHTEHGCAHLRDVFLDLISWWNYRWFCDLGVCWIPLSLVVGSEHIVMSFNHHLPFRPHSLGGICYRWNIIFSSNPLQIHFSHWFYIKSHCTHALSLKKAMCTWRYPVSNPPMGSHFEKNKKPVWTGGVTELELIYPTHNLLLELFRTVPINIKRASIARRKRAKPCEEHQTTGLVRN